MPTRFDPSPMLLAMAALLAACSGSSPPNATLQNAHAAYVTAMADPNVSTAAAPDLQRAETYLDSGDTAVKKGADQAEVSHRAYLAQQQINIAYQDAKLQRLSAQIRGTPRSVAAQGSVFFPTGGSRPAPGSEGAIAKVALFLKRNPDQRVRIEGYTDSQGSEAANAALSQRRADAVRDTLVSRGIAADRIQAHGNGDASPVASNATAQGRQMNRRAVVVLSNLPRSRSGSSAPPDAQGEIAGGR